MSIDDRFSQELREQRDEQQTGTLSEAITVHADTHAAPRFAPLKASLQEDTI